MKGTDNNRKKEKKTGTETERACAIGTELGHSSKSSVTFILALLYWIIFNNESAIT